MPPTTTPGTRPGSGSDIVVPFSEIAALLQSRLSDLELNDLLSRLVGSRSALVQPGDLITADWAMDVETRLTRLERGGPGAGLSSLNARAVKTLLETFDAYSRLAGRRTFLPDGTAADAVSAAFGMTTTIQSVLVLAAATTGLASSASPDGLVDIFQRLYSAQKDLGVLFNSSIPGVSNPAPRLLFAQRLLGVLDTDDGVTGALSLRNALSRSDADATILAQNRVNGIVATESGDSVVGTIDVAYRGSTRGETLVLADAQPFGYIFRVTNKTNRPLRVQLTADFAPPRESWSAGVTVVGGAGQVLDLRPFDPANPNDPAAMRDIQVNVATPAGAALNDAGTLRLRAFVPPPINVAGLGTVLLTVGNAATAPQPTRVRYLGTVPVVESGSLTALSPGQPVELRFDAMFTTSVGATTRDFRFRLVAANTAVEAGRFSITFLDPDVPIDNAASTALSKQSQAFPLSDGQRRSIGVQISALAGAAGTTLNLTATVEAVADPTISDARSFTARAV